MKFNDALTEFGGVWGACSGHVDLLVVTQVEDSPLKRVNANLVNARFLELLETRV